MQGYSEADYFNSYQDNRSRLGDFYQAQWGNLQAKEVNWLNKFQAPASYFLQLAVARDAVVRLYLAVLPELERRSKAAGSTLPQDARDLEALDKAYADLFRWRGYHVSLRLAGPKAGAAVYFSIFECCENAVRVHFDMEAIPATFFASFAGADESFDTFFGDYLSELLPPLAAALPPPDEATELAINQFEHTRWEPRYEALRAMLPADPAGFASAVFALGQLNERNPVIAPLYLEAARLLAGLGQVPEQVVRLYLHYLSYGGQHRYPFKPKPLPKRMQKLLFPRPEQLARFEALTAELLTARDQRAALTAALAAVPTIYQPERRKIELSPAAVRAARQQHAGTVELLNEYLREEPEPLLAAAAPDATELELTLLAAPAAGLAAPAAGGSFAAGFGLSPAQLALLLHFGSQALTLSRTAVEALAQAHGTLRNQLIDGLNEACADVLDDVLIEETDGGYTIYEPYYQRLTAPC